MEVLDRYGLDKPLGLQVERIVSNIELDLDRVVPLL